MSVRDDYPELGRIANGLGVLVLEDAEAQALRALDEIAKWRGMHADIVRRSNAFAESLPIPIVRMVTLRRGDEEDLHGEYSHMVISPPWEPWDSADAAADADAATSAVFEDQKLVPIEYVLETWMLTAVETRAITPAEASARRNGTDLPPAPGGGS